MFAIIDTRVPIEVKKNLQKYTDGIFEFYSDNITFESISGHPDIFMFQDNEKLIIAPNSPISLFNFLNEHNINYSLGKLPVGKSLAESVLYNCLSTEKYVFYKQGCPDDSIVNHCANKTHINISQAFARCSMIEIDNTFITSDKGIVKALKKHKLDFCYVDPSEIKINIHKHGFIGGAMGVSKNQVFFLGNILKHQDGEALQKYINILGKEIICLGNDYLYDGGGIFFI